MPSTLQIFFVHSGPCVQKPCELLIGQAQKIERNQPEPKPHFTVSPLLREQNFGEAERQPFGEKSGYVRQSGRTFKFAQGESLEDVRSRANQA